MIEASFGPTIAAWSVGMNNRNALIIISIIAVGLLTTGCGASTSSNTKLGPSEILAASRIKMRSVTSWATTGTVVSTGSRSDINMSASKKQQLDFADP